MKCCEYVPRGSFVEQKVKPSFCFMCVHINYDPCHEFGHTLLCSLSLTKMINTPASGLYLHFIFFLPYAWTQQAKVFLPDKSLHPNVMLLSSLFAPLLNHEWNEV